MVDPLGSGHQPSFFAPQKNFPSFSANFFSLRRLLAIFHLARLWTPKNKSFSLFAHVDVLQGLPCQISIDETSGAIKGCPLMERVAGCEDLSCDRPFVVKKTSSFRCDGTEVATRSLRRTGPLEKSWANAPFSSRWPRPRPKPQKSDRSFESVLNR